MGQHCWLLLATVLTEMLVIIKWSRGMFQEPLPLHVQWGWIVGGTLLVLYPIARVGRSPTPGCGTLTRAVVWCACCTTIPAQTRAEAQEQDAVIVSCTVIWVLINAIVVDRTRDRARTVANVLVFTRAGQISITKSTSHSTTRHTYRPLITNSPCSLTTTVSLTPTMNNNNQDNNRNPRGRHFSHNFHIGTTIQNVFRNINHAFTRDHDSSSGQHNSSRGRTNNNMPPLEPLNSAGGRHVTRPADSAHPLPSPAVPEPSMSSAFPPAEMDMPPHLQLDSQRDEDEDSMPELRSATDSSDESDAGLATFNPVPLHQDIHPADDDPNSVWTDEEGDPPPMTGTRRARVDDDGDDARDRRHPSERVGGPPPQGDAAPQNANRQQLPRAPAGLFGALFGLGPPGGDAPHEHTHTGEGTPDSSTAGNNPTPGHVPRGVPILIAGFTLTIPLFGAPPGNRTGPAGDGQGAPPGVFGMDAAAREELLASFAAFFQEFQGLDEGREDPERAKKLMAGLDVVPLGLVKRLERVGGAPGGHIVDSNTEGTSGCAICWDTLLDAEGDSFSGQQFSGGDVPQSSEARTDDHLMDVDAPPISVSQSEPETSASNPPSAEPAKIISLPCAHVFHASCLIPWFTRARQATCPTCRFNIDPENLTYTPPARRMFNRGPPPQPDNAVPNPVPADPQAAPGVPSEVPPADVRAADAAAPPVDPVRMTADAATGAVPFGPAPPPPAGQGGFNPFVAMPGIPILSFPAIQVPLRPNAAQAPGGDNQGMSFPPTAPHSRTVSLPSSTNEYPFAPTGMDVLTIGFDMFVGGPPPEERGGDARGNAEGAGGAEDGGAGAGAAGGNGAANPNGLAQDLHSLIEGLLRSTRNMVPPVVNGQGPVPAPAPGAAPAAGTQPQPQARPEAAGPQPIPPPMGNPRVVPIIPLRSNMFRPTRPMPRERKTWTLPSAPGPSLRQRVEQREREQGLRCSDTSCGVGPSDDDPYPEPSGSLMKQVSIHPLPDHETDSHVSVCAHAFHPACLVSAERVAGWGGEDKTEPLVEVSCPVCRSVGCVTREEWDLGVLAL